MEKASWLLALTLCAIIAPFVALLVNAEHIQSLPANFAYEQFLPKEDMTPGDILKGVTRENVCTRGYAKKVRSVAESEKKKVFEEYNISPDSDHFEIDHLISLELGGSNEISNLWPQSYTTHPWNAHLKDALEDHMHHMVCVGDISLEDAQKEIAEDWIAAYKKYMAKDQQ